MLLFSSPRPTNNSDRTSLRSNKSMELIKQIAVFEREILPTLEERQKLIYEKDIHYCDILLSVLFLSGLSMVPCFFFYPLVLIYLHPEDYQGLNLKNLPLPARCWFPFDTYEHYTLAFVLQMFALFIGFGMTVHLNVVLVGFMVFCKAQLMILQCTLKDFRRNATIEVNNEDSIIKFLGGCVQRHRNITRFVEDLNKLIRNVVMVEFLANGLEFASFGFQVVEIKIGYKQLFDLTCLFYVICQMLLWQIHGNMVSLESVRVSDAIWESEWYDCSESVKKILHIMMLRAQKPLILNVGWFAEMSAETALSILRIAYSFTTLMRQTYARRNA